MTQLSTFTTSLAQLVWTLVHRPEDEAAPDAAVHAALTSLDACQERETVVLTDVSFAVASAFQDGTLGEHVAWLSELSVRMAAHSVRSVEVERGASPDEVMQLARAIACAPVTGDEGESFDLLVQQMEAPHLEVHIGRQGFVRRGTPVLSQRALVGPARTPPTVRAVAESRPRPADATRNPEKKRAEATGGLVEDETARIFAAQAVDPVRGIAALGDLLEQLRERDGAPARPAMIEAVGRAAEERARQGLWVDLAVVLDRFYRNHDALADGDLKRAYLIGIRRLESPTFMHGVVTLLPRRREMRGLVTSILSRAGEVGADALLEAFLASDITVERRAYRSALAQCPAAVPALRHLLGDSRWFVVRNAAELLGELAPADADVEIARVLTHGEPRVRRSAVQALAKLATPRAVLALLQVLHDPSPEVRVQVALALGAIRSPRALPWLLEALDRESDVDVQAALVTALGRIPTDESVGRLIRVAESGGRLLRKPTPLRVHAVQALASADTPAALDSLRRLQQDRVEEVRAAAARAMHSRGAAKDL